MVLLEVPFWCKQHLDIFLSGGYKQNTDLSEMSHLWNIWTFELFDQKCYSLSKHQFISFPDSRKEKSTKILRMLICLIIWSIGW